MTEQKTRMALSVGELDLIEEALEAYRDTLVDQVMDAAEHGDWTDDEMREKYRTLKELVLKMRERRNLLAEAYMRAARGESST